MVAEGKDEIARRKGEGVVEWQGEAEGEGRGEERRVAGRRAQGARGQGRV